MSVVVRFAPSPTGLIHVGNVRTALLNFLFARRNGGRFILRIDDTDQARSTKEFEDGIHADLAWLGLAHDLSERQSARMEVYRAAFDRLVAEGRLKVKEIVSHRFPLEGINEAFDRLRRGEALRSIVVPGGG